MFPAVPETSRGKILIYIYIYIFKWYLFLNLTVMLSSSHFDLERIFFFLKVLVNVIKLDENLQTFCTQGIT